MNKMTLTPPEKVEVVTVEQAATGMIALNAEQTDPIKEKASAYVDRLMELDFHTPEFQEVMDNSFSVGYAQIVEATNISNRLLDAPQRSITGISETSKVGGSLGELRNVVDNLDPSNQGGNLLEPRKILGFIPMGNRLVEYFRKYESAQTKINAIVQSLRNGKDELERDNVAIKMEVQNMYDAMIKIEQYILLTSEIQNGVQARIAEITVPEKANLVKDKVLFNIVQQHQELLTTMAVMIQGYQALQMTIKNNEEAIRGVDRALTTTVSTLRTAVIIAQALANQKLVLDQVSALREATGNMLVSNAAMLGQNSAQVQDLAKNPSVGIEQLQEAFKLTFDAMDEMNNFRAEATEIMIENTKVLAETVDGAKERLGMLQEPATKQANDLVI